MAAYCLHPIYQNRDAGPEAEAYLQEGPALVREYVREDDRVASRQLRQHIVERGVHDRLVVKPVVLSDMIGVHLLLIADKVQNKKDFMKHRWVSATPCTLSWCR